MSTISRPLLNDSQRAVITGMGPVTAIGLGKEALWQGLLAEKSPIQTLTRFEITDQKAKHSAEIRDFKISDWFSPHESKRWDLCTSFAMVAAELAIRDSGFDPRKAKDPSRIGVCMGSALGGIADAENAHQKFLGQGCKSVPRALALQIFGGATHSNVTIQYGIEGPATTHSNSCASGNVALGEAMRWIRQGLADVVLAGAAESPISPLTFTAFDHVHTMSRWQGTPMQRACCPFDKDRDGFVMGEGASVFMVESLAHARARGAKIYAEVLGYGMASEAHHMTSPRPDGIPVLRAMSAALNDACRNTSDIGYINAHASSTPQNDWNESCKIAELFGQRQIPVSGTKPYTGHPLGAAGAMEIAICLLALENQWLPPTLHLEESNCHPALDYIAKHGRETTLQHVLTNSFGFGGIDTSLVLGKF